MKNKKLKTKADQEKHDTMQYGEGRVIELEVWEWASQGL